MKWSTKYQGREYIAYGTRSEATARLTGYLGFTPDPLDVHEVTIEPASNLVDFRKAPGS